MSLTKAHRSVFRIMENARNEKVTDCSSLPLAPVAPTATSSHLDVLRPACRRVMLVYSVCSRGSSKAVGEKRSAEGQSPSSVVTTTLHHYLHTLYLTSQDIY